MRLTCPNCGAQYEVPDDVIPKDGRDVQCSNCGTTWFQPHGDAMNPEPTRPDPEELRSALADLGETPPEPESHKADLADEVHHEDEDKGDDTATMPDQTPSPAPAPARRSLDPEVTDILKEEAEHEAQLRARESSSLETQPDLGLDDTADDAERRAYEARSRMERLKGPDADMKVEEAVAAAAAAAAATAQPSRRDRLPDIDEINSSLRPSNAPAGVQDHDRGAMDDEPRKSGFARGFAIPLLIMVILVLIYANAPRIAEAVPALGSALNSYVLAVDQLRMWLNEQLSAFMP
ncbi:MAG: zinc-ribbon domain-containing protein [Aestuariivita sp.]|uniref:zinc-ribbon domain-containing protein n=1 Tax=Aestuariivita sp. TaxID=1872407 RepID=UPI003BAEA1E7